MHVHVLASGSSGNCTLVTAGQGNQKVRVVLDCGIPQRTGRLLAERCGESLTQIDAVLMTHHHADHSKNVVPVASRARVPLYAHDESFGSKSYLSKKERERRKIDHRSIQDQVPFSVGPLSITPIQLPHDAGFTFGFLFETENARAGYFTDLGTADVLRPHLHSLNLLVLEANHDFTMLRDGPYPRILQDRVSGPEGHLSNQQTADLLQEAAGPSLHTLVLAHLSKENNTPEKALQTIRPVLNQNVCVHIAPPLGPLSLEATAYLNKL